MRNRPKDVCYPNRGLSRALRVRIVRLIQLGWQPSAIVENCRVSLSTVYNYTKNVVRYDSSRPPALRKLGRPRKLASADEHALLEHLLLHGYLQQEEMRYWLWCERGVLVDRSTISRLLKRRNWTRKELRWISLGRSAELRRAWREDMRRFVAEGLVFLDESIFNEKTGWRYQAYGPIGEDIRYPANTQRGKTWSICAATTVEGWLPCTGVKEGYFKTPDLIRWLKTALLPALRLDSLRPRVIILDNCSTHISSTITDVIEAEGHLIRFLPPYSPDFNPIELSFSVLKAWFQRNYVWTRRRHGSFGDYLVWAISKSKCSRFAREQFRHAAGGLYAEEKGYEAFRVWMRAWETAGAEEVVGEWTDEEIVEGMRQVMGVVD